MSTQYPMEVVPDLLDGLVRWQEQHQIMSGCKDSDGLAPFCEILTERLGWSDPIVLPLSESLVIVRTADGWEIRELICPGCARLLELGAVAPGYLLTFEVLPDLEVFDSGFLGESLTEPRRSS